MQLVNPFDEDHGRVVVVSALEHLADVADEAVQIEDHVSGNFERTELSTLGRTYFVERHAKTVSLIFSSTFFAKSLTSGWFVPIRVMML